MLNKPIVGSAPGNTNEAPQADIQELAEFFEVSPDKAANFAVRIIDHIKQVTSAIPQADVHRLGALAKIPLDRVPAFAYFCSVAIAKRIAERRETPFSPNLSIKEVGRILRSARACLRHIDAMSVNTVLFVDFVELQKLEERSRLHHALTSRHPPTAYKSLHSELSCFRTRIDALVALLASVHEFLVRVERHPSHRLPDEPLTDPDERFAARVYGAALLLGGKLPVNGSKKCPDGTFHEVIRILAQHLPGDLKRSAAQRLSVHRQLKIRKQVTRNPSVLHDLYGRTVHNKKSSSS